MKHQVSYTLLRQKSLQSRGYVYMYINLGLTSIMLPFLHPSRTRMRKENIKGNFFGFVIYFMSVIQNRFICRPSDSTVLEDARDRNPELEFLKSLWGQGTEEE